MASAPSENMSYIDNGKVKLGIDLDMGGSITYISKSGSDLNLVNSADLGRQIQMSHYSFPVPFEPNGKKSNPAWTYIGWNPIQSGDVAGNKSKVLAHKNDGKSIYVKCIPMHWPLDNVPGECTFECWITLKQNTIHVKSRMLNNRPDKTKYPARGQEMPAVYTNGPWWKLMTYIGDKPFTRDKLTQTPAAFMWKNYSADECWSALINDEGWGLGLWEPGVYLTTGGFAGKPGKGGPKDGPTGYFAPLMEEILDYNIDTRYSYVMILGTLKEIRDYVYKQPRPAEHPNWVFSKSRHYWTYKNAVDTGWPIKRELDIDLSSDDVVMVGPRIFFHASKNPTLYIKAAFTTSETQATVMWERRDLQPVNEWGGKGFGAPTKEEQMSFPITGDGKYRVYTVPLADAAAYKGIITKLHVKLATKGSPGQHVKVASIGFVKPKGDR